MNLRVILLGERTLLAVKLLKVLRKLELSLLPTQLLHLRLQHFRRRTSHLSHLLRRDAFFLPVDNLFVTSPMKTGRLQEARLFGVAQLLLSLDISRDFVRVIHS